MIHSKMTMGELFARFGWLFVLAIAVSIFNLAYMLSYAHMSYCAYLLSAWTMPLAIYFWIECDARSRRATPSYDFGFFIFIASSFLIPVYLIQTYKWQGLLLLLLMIAFWILPVYVPVIIANSVFF